MDSSTLPSEKRLPNLAVRLILTAILTWVSGALYTIYLNPEVTFFRRVHQSKVAWEKTLPDSKRILFVAGSSCMTSLDPVALRNRHGIDALNLGLGAGMGPRLLARYAIDRAHRGDSLLLSFEQGLLIGPLDWEPLGLQFAMTTDDPKRLLQFEGPPVSQILLALRPGGYHLFTLLGKALLQQPWYRYSSAEIQTGGWHQVSVRRPVSSPGPGPTKLSSEARIWLKEIHRECEKKGIRVAYTPPLLYGADSEATIIREANRRFLTDVESILPVLSDAGLGVNTNLTDYADTVAHLNGAGAQKNTDRIAALVKAWGTK